MVKEPTIELFLFFSSFTQEAFSADKNKYDQNIIRVDPNLIMEGCVHEMQENNSTVLF